jgi:TRAP-type C4-dicarboxylate transport system substrate-binding protein
MPVQTRSVLTFAREVQHAPRFALMGYGLPRQFLKVAGAAALGLLFLASARAQPLSLDLKSSYQANTPSGAAVEAFVTRANALSNGTLRLSLSSADGYEDAFRSVERGGVALGTFEAPALYRIEPVLGLSSLPMIAGSFDEARALATVARPHYEAALARHAQKLLLLKAYRPVLIWSRSPFVSTKEIAGAQVIAGRRGWYGPLQRLGARETSSGTPDFLIASSRNANIAIYGSSLRHVTQVFWAMPVQFITINSSAFSALPTAAQQALMTAGADLEKEEWNSAMNGARTDYAEAEAKGVTVQVAPPGELIEALREAAQPDINAWAADVGAPARQILEEYRRLMKR